LTRWTLAALASVAVAMAALLFAFTSGFGRDPHEVPFILRGQPAPDFTLTRLDTGEQVSLASWCGPCQLEHPTLARAAQRYQQEVRFFGVVFEDTPENARAFARPMDPSFPQLVDPQSRMAVDYGVSGVPETYFIDARGIIRDKYVGPLLDARELAGRLALLREPSAPGASR
jgi:cytochrome c biogenesis protein CcmG/thiol:disulfide interchange protein DsbE